MSQKELDSEIANILSLEIDILDTYLLVERLYNSKNIQKDVFWRNSRLMNWIQSNREEITNYLKSFKRS